MQRLMPQRWIKVIARITLISLFTQLMLTGLAQAADNVVYFHNDALGSPVAATDQTGRVLWREEYKPYGKRLLNQNESAGNQLWFTGKYEEAELGGLQYFGVRWYHPDAGRFMSMDPAGVIEHVESNPMMFNRYAYANNNPYSFVDPDGELPVPLILLGVAALTSTNNAQAPTSAGDIHSNMDTKTLEGVAVVEGAWALSGLLSGARGLLGGADDVAKGASKEITKSSRKRVKRLVKDLSDNSRQNNGLSQEKTDQLRRIVEKAGGKIRNDGASGVKGSSAGKPHVQTEGLGKSIDSRHIWTKEGVQ